MMRSGLIAVLAAALAFAIPAAAAPRDTLVIGLQQEPTSLDPTSDATASIDSVMTASVFETLTTSSGLGEVRPLLAKAWEVSADGTVYTFHLNEGVKFTDGEALDSAVVKFSFDRAMAPDSVNPSKGIFAPIAAIETPDATTVVIRLKQPDAYFLNNLAAGDAAIVHPKTAATNKSNPVGSGVYKLKQWAKGDRVVLERNPAHRDAAKAALREVTFRIMPDPTAATAAIMAGDIDAFPAIPAPETIEQFRKDPRFKVVVGTTEGEVILALNNSKKPFDDIRVRRAISHALNRQDINDGAQGGLATPIGSHFPPHNPAYVDLTGLYPHDVAKARALLNEAGYPNGFEASLQLPPFAYARRSGEIVAQQLGEAGIRVKVTNVEFPYWLAEVYKKKNYDMTIVAHIEPRDIGNYARDASYYYGYDGARFAEKFNDFRRTVDPAEQKRKLGDLQRFIAEEAVHGFLFQLPAIGVYKVDLAGYWTNAPELITPLIDIHWVR
jgi:peptide/nickel transport system substrate-binding protein